MLFDSLFKISSDADIVLLRRGHASNNVNKLHTL